MIHKRYKVLSILFPRKTMLSFFLFACAMEPPPLNMEEVFQESIRELNLKPVKKQHMGILTSDLPNKETLSFQYFPEQEII